MNEITDNSARDRARLHRIRLIVRDAALREMGLSGFFHMGIFVTVIAVGAFVAWAWQATLDEATVTKGRVVPGGALVSVQHLEGGIIAKLMTKDGDIVEKGQVIAEFDGTAAKSEYEKLQIRQDTLSVRAERFRAFAEGREPRFPQTSHNMTTLIHEELNVLGAKNTDRIERLGLIDQQIKSFRGEISAFQAELQVKQRLLKLAADEVSIYKKLEHSKNVSAIKLLAGC